MKKNPSSYLDNSAFVKAKINNAGVLALGYSQSLRPGVRASFGLALDTTKLHDVAPSGPAHKVNKIKSGPAMPGYHDLMLCSQVGVNFVFES